MFAFKSLQRRLTVLLLVPVTLFLLVIGVFGYRFIQGLLFKDWQEIAILRHPLEPLDILYRINYITHLSQLRIA